MKKITFVFALAVFLGSALSPVWAAEQAPIFGKGRVTVIHANGKQDTFSADVATTSDQHQYGLKNRKSLPKDSGMLFIFHPAGNVSFWMQDTLIPLDMLFISDKGQIFKIAPNNKPLDLTAVPSGQAAGAVLEINGGESFRRGIIVGDSVTYKIQP